VSAATSQKHNPQLLWRSRVQRLGLADSVLVLLPAGVRHHVHAANFEESPVYAEIKAKGQTSKNPWREAFLDR
jgi:hypothetical protein